MDIIDFKNKFSKIEEELDLFSKNNEWWDIVRYDVYQTTYRNIEAINIHEPLKQPILSRFKNITLRIFYRILLEFKVLISSYDVIV